MIVFTVLDGVASEAGHLDFKPAASVGVARISQPMLTIEKEKPAYYGMRTKIQQPPLFFLVLWTD